ncbi:periplasmic heavy metal sensor [Novosphingobium sp. BL-8A]|uniref:periplasmic heavy metal sensor n=1 Tax=Novosphingobium sp. BL-8A TaxID=3127639 RepID=UPI0037571A9B
MNNSLRLGLVVLLAFVAALGGVLVGRAWIAPKPPVESEIHELLHAQLKLDPDQTRKIEAIEQQYGLRRQALELELRSANARLAAAIEAEHGYGPQVAAAVDSSHRAMGELQKVTLEHVFAMRGVLHPDQTARFDAAVVKALTPQQP